MSAGDTFENDLQLLIWNNTNAALIGDATGLRGSSTAGSFYVALHTSDPGESGSQNTNETSYTNYARVAVARSAGGWTVAANGISNTAVVTFPTCGVTGATITHFSVGTASSGAGKILFSAALNSSLAVSQNIAPSFAIGALTNTVD